MRPEAFDVSMPSRSDRRTIPRSPRSLVLEPAYRGGHGGLHDVFTLGTSGDAALVCYCDEVGELPQFHAGSIAYTDGSSENIRWTWPGLPTIVRGAMHGNVYKEDLSRAVPIDERAPPMATHNSAARLNGKVALITGGSRGIGAAVTRRLAAEGATVAVNYQSDVAAADALVTEIAGNGGRAVALQADVSDPA
jgi:hypothetical protein